jgi:F-type H+-transporting ATPase subunit a
MVIAGVYILRKKAPIVLEMLIDFIDGLAAGFISGPTAPYIPFLGALFLFIAVANVIGIVPMMFTPTRDINTPLALALVLLFTVFAFGIYAKGIGGFAKSFSNPMIPLDLIGYFSRTMSLTLRLFGNIISSEIIVAVFFLLVPVGVPLIMVVISTFTGILQAYVFTVLASSYISSSIES